MPSEAHFPSLTTIASGVARPKLQGQAITKMVTKVINDSLKSLVISKYNIKVMMAIKMTIGTKMPDTLSATLEIGDLVLLASITI